MFADQPTSPPGASPGSDAVIHPLGCLPALKQTRRFLVLGLLTAAPLWVTWLVFDFLFSQLSDIGIPWVNALARAVGPFSQVASELLQREVFQSALGVLLTLVVFYLLGWMASRVIGQRIIGWLERLLQGIPLVAAIYGGVKRFVAVVKEKPAGVQRVVLISFPNNQMKALGFVTRVLRDEQTGEEVAAVYVPTSPNPTSGYIEIVPLSRLVATDWTMDEAMSFVITGGATSPETIRFYGSQSDGEEIRAAMATQAATPPPVAIDPDAIRQSGGA